MDRGPRDKHAAVPSARLDAFQPTGAEPLVNGIGGFAEYPRGHLHGYEIGLVNGGMLQRHCWRRGRALGETWARLAGSSGLSVPGGSSVLLAHGKQFSTREADTPRPSLRDGERGSEPKRRGRARCSAAAGQRHKARRLKGAECRCC